MSVNQNLFSKKQSLNSEGSFDKVQQSIIVASGAKIHRASILARIIHSISLYKMQWAMRRIKILAANRKVCYQKMGLAINRIFRRSAHEHKFNAFHKIRQQLLQASSYEIQQNHKILQSMSKASKTIIFIVLKAKRRQIISESFAKIKNYSIQTYTKKRNNQRIAIRKILQFIFKNKRLAFDKIVVSKVIVQRRNKIRSLVFLLQTQRVQKLGWSFWKLRRNLIDKRREQVQNDIKAFQSKLNNFNDPQLEAVRQKKSKLEEHLNKVQQQKAFLQQQFMAQHNQLQNRRKQYQTQISSLQQKKLALQSQIEQTQNQINSPYSLDQIYQCVYYNFLLYLNENKQKIYNKEQVLASLTYPLVPIQVPIDTIKEQNKVLQQLLNEYIVMFGHRKLQSQITLPYQYLVKQNRVMYKMLLTLLPQVEGDREDLGSIRDSLFKLGARVNQTWGR